MTCGWRFCSQIWTVWFHIHFTNMSTSKKQSNFTELAGWFSSIWVSVHLGFHPFLFKHINFKIYLIYKKKLFTNLDRLVANSRFIANSVCHSSVLGVDEFDWDRFVTKRMCQCCAWCWIKIDRIKNITFKFNTNVKFTARLLKQFTRMHDTKRRTIHDMRMICTNWI